MGAHSWSREILWDAHSSSRDFVALVLRISATALTGFSIDLSKFWIDLSELLLALCGFSIDLSEKIIIVFHESDRSST